MPRAENARRDSICQSIFGSVVGENYVYRKMVRNLQCAAKTGRPSEMLVASRRLEHHRRYCSQPRSSTERAGNHVENMSMPNEPLTRSPDVLDDKTNDSVSALSANTDHVSSMYYISCFWDGTHPATTRIAVIYHIEKSVFALALQNAGRHGSSRGCEGERGRLFCSNGIGVQMALGR